MLGPTGLDATGVQLPGDLFEADAVVQVGVEEEHDDIRLAATVGNETLVLDPIAEQRRPAVPPPFGEPSPLGFRHSLAELPAEVLGDHQLDAATKRIASLGRRDDRHAHVLEVRDDRVGPGRTSESVPLVDVQRVDQPGFAVGNQAVEGFP